MRRHITEVLAVAGGALALGACGDEPRSSSSATSPTSPLLEVSAPACNVTLVRSTAIRYLDDDRTLIARIAALESAVKSGNIAQATARGFDVLSRAADIIRAGDQVGTPVQGDQFVRQTLACMRVGDVTTRHDFVAALSPNGLFEVRGDDSRDPAFAPILSRSSIPYGAEPTGSASWGASSGGVRFLVIGFPRSFTFTPESPAPQTTAFELLSLPAPPTVRFNPRVLVGACLLTTTPQTRLQHSNLVLALFVPSFCAAIPTPPSTSLRFSARESDEGAAGVAGMARRVAAFFAPRPLHAATLGTSSSAVLGGVGGLASNFSPFGAVVPAGVKLRFTRQPRTSAPNVPISPPVHVEATTLAGTPIEGVAITLTIASGGPAGLTGNTATTGREGIATFPKLAVDRTGTFTLLATGLLSGFTPATVTSASFTIR